MLVAIQYFKNDQNNKLSSYIFRPDSEVMCEVSLPSIPAIEDSIGSTNPEDYKTVTERYYTKFYCVDQDRDKHQDILVLNHSNKICLITVAPTHPVIADKLRVNKVNFEVSKKIDRKSNKTSGKSKKGGQALEHSSILAIIETDSGSYPVKVSCNFAHKWLISICSCVFRLSFLAN